MHRKTCLLEYVGAEKASFIEDANRLPHILAVRAVRTAPDGQRMRRPPGLLEQGLEQLGTQAVSRKKIATLVWDLSLSLRR